MTTGGVTDGYDGLDISGFLSELNDGPLQTFFVVGGPVVWILCVFSVIALTITLIKLWQFWRLEAESLGDVQRSLGHWRQGDAEAAIAVLVPARPVSSLVLCALRGLSGAVSVASVKPDQSVQLREELERQALEKLHEIRAFLRPLEVIASLSPLLGLLGTVLGMIGAFQQMELAGNQVDPSVLSGGIWQALLTTAVGLAIAIPVVTIHNWLDRKAERVAHQMNDAVTRVFTQAPAVFKASTDACTETKAEVLSRAA